MTSFNLDLIQEFLIKHWVVVIEVWIPWSMIIMGGILFVLETSGGIKVGYGRYNTSGIGLNVKSPNLIFFFDELI